MQKTIKKTNKPSNFPDLSEHRIFLFYSLMRQPGEQWNSLPSAKTCKNLLVQQHKMAEKEKSEWIYADAESFFEGKYADCPVWQPSTLKLGKDLHPHIHNALGKANQQMVDASVYELSQQTKNFIVEGKLVCNPDSLTTEQKKRKRIKLNFRQSALLRIQKQFNMDVQTLIYTAVKNIQAICFRTGSIIFVVEAKVVLSDHSPVHPELLQEVLAILTNINKLSWDDPSQSKAEPENYFSLGEMISGLAGLPKKNKAQRVYSATYLQFAQAPEVDPLKKLQIRISRHYTNNYDIVDEPRNLVTVQEFNNIAHCFSLEGCSSYCISKQTSSDGFLSNYLNATYRLHYLPIIILAVHEYTHLVKLTNDSSFWPDLNNTKALTQLTQLRDEILHFRLCFRYSVVSQITMHNQANLALRKTLGLDILLQELDNDTNEINAFLEQQNAENFNKKIHWISMLGAAVITLTASYQSLHILLPDLFQTFGIDWVVWKTNAILSALFSVVAVIIVRRTKPTKE